MRWFVFRRPSKPSSFRRVIEPSAFIEMGRYGTIVIRARSAGLKWDDSVGLIASRLSLIGGSLPLSSQDATVMFVILSVARLLVRMIVVFLKSTRRPSPSESM